MGGAFGGRSKAKYSTTDRTRKIHRTSAHQDDQPPIHSRRFERKRLRKFYRRTWANKSCGAFRVPKKVVILPIFYEYNIRGARSGAAGQRVIVLNLVWITNHYCCLASRGYESYLLRTTWTKTKKPQGPKLHILIFLLFHLFSANGLFRSTLHYYCFILHAW